VRIFARTLKEQQGDMFQQADIVFEELKRIGVQVVERRGLHQKFAFIDRNVAWEGSLNILSQSKGRSTEHMRRLPFPKTCEELIDLHNFGSDSETEPGSRRPVQTDRKCEKCGSTMVIVNGLCGAGHGLACSPLQLRPRQDADDRSPNGNDGPTPGPRRGQRRVGPQLQGLGPPRECLVAPSLPVA
jgi:hypothetical protein